MTCLSLCRVSVSWREQIFVSVNSRCKSAIYMHEKLPRLLVKMVGTCNYLDKGLWSVTNDVWDITHLWYFIHRDSSGVPHKLPALWRNHGMWSDYVEQALFMDNVYLDKFPLCGSICWDWYTGCYLFIHMWGQKGGEAWMSWSLCKMRVSKFFLPRTSGATY